MQCAAVSTTRSSTSTPEQAATLVWKSAGEALDVSRNRTTVLAMRMLGGLKNGDRSSASHTDWSTSKRVSQFRVRVHVNGWTSYSPG